MYVISAARGLNKPKTLQHWSWLHHCRWKAGVFDLLLQLNRLRSTMGQNRPNHLSLSIESNAKGCLNVWACMPVRSECACRPCQITSTVLHMALNYVFSAWSVKKPHTYSLRANDHLNPPLLLPSWEPLLPLWCFSAQSSYLSRHPTCFNTI